MASIQHIDEIASVYAQSLLEVCDRQGGIALAESCSSELNALAEIIRSDRRFAEFLRTPIVGASARRASLDRIVREYPETSAARKARQRLGIPEPQIPLEAPTGEPVQPEPVAEPEEDSNLPRGFRAKKR